MSGFSPEWLRLREPADHRARAPELAARLGDYVAGRDRAAIIDLGCGAGSNLRWLAPRLPVAQDWLLIDYDARLLDAARQDIAGWRERAAPADLTVGFERLDLNAGLEALLDRPFDILTASALFDLVSRSWLDRLIARLKGRRRAFYTVLIYDGVMRWNPEHPADEPIAGAFNAHQRSDKGFGAAAGPDAAAYLQARLREAGYDVMAAASPWRLDRADMPLILATARGVADAARETGLVPHADIDDWMRSRAAVQGCEIGHIDLLALPG